MIDHLSHAASLCLLSNFDEALIVTMDAVGEMDYKLNMIGKNDHIEFKEENKFFSLSWVTVSAFTYLWF